MKSVKQLQKSIENCVREAGTYSPALALNYYMLAAALYRYQLCLSEVEQAAEVTVTATNGAMQQHPAAKMMIDTETSILRQLKELGLNAEGTRGNTEGDPITALIADMRQSMEE